jgi:hypothetical protein
LKQSNLKSRAKLEPSDPTDNGWVFYSILIAADSLINLISDRVRFTRLKADLIWF